MLSSVARVSAPSTTPSLYTTPTIVVPVLVALGAGKPLLSKKAFLREIDRVNVLVTDVGVQITVTALGVTMNLKQQSNQSTQLACVGIVTYEVEV